jgi:hypothetical protein
MMLWNRMTPEQQEQLVNNLVEDECDGPSLHDRVRAVLEEWTHVGIEWEPDDLDMFTNDVLEAAGLRRRT